MMSTKEAKELIKATKSYKDLSEKRWNRFSELMKDRILSHGSDRDYFKEQMKSAMRMIVFYDGMIEKLEIKIEDNTERLLKVIFKDDYIAPEDRRERP